MLAGDHAKLMDALDGKILVNRNARTCVAELSPGERVSAFGALARGHDPEASPEVAYRSAPLGFILRPPEGAKMLLSTYAIDRPFEERARRIRWWVVFLLTLVVAAHGSVLGYHLRALFGQRIEATVTNANLVRRETEDGEELERMATLMLPAAGSDRIRASMTEEVTEQSFPNAKPGRTLTVFFDPVLSTVNFGEHATAPFWFVFVVALVIVICLCLGDSDQPDAKWYLEKKVVEQGSGRLPDVAPGGVHNVSEIRALVDEALGRRH